MDKQTCPICRSKVQLSQYHDAYYCKSCQEYVDPNTSQTEKAKLNIELDIDEEE